MKFRQLLLLLVLCPFHLWAQAAPLKSIEYRELGTTFYRGRASVQRIYSYDGVDILNPKRELPAYLLALGDSATTGAYNQYVQIRSGNTAASVWGLLLTGAGCGFGGSYMNAIRQQRDAQYNSSYPYKAQNQPTYKGRAVAGLVFILLGGILCGVGSSSYKVTQSLHRAVQTYNRALEGRRVSWSVEPSFSFGNTGVSLVGRF